MIVAPEVETRPWAEQLAVDDASYRAQLAYLFDPYLALSTSLIEPLPHQITAVYGEMLPRQPLRFLLADDPGAGKTFFDCTINGPSLIRAPVLNRFTETADRGQCAASPPRTRARAHRRMTRQSARATGSSRPR